MNTKSIISFIFFSILFIGILILPNGCVHDPVSGIVDPIDTMAIDTDTVVINPPILIDSTGVKCDSTKIYFDVDVKPIIAQNCAISGCHAAGTYSDGVNLENYQKIIATGKIKANDLNSKFYNAITTNDTDDVMPPPPSKKLSNDQINIISLWIQQGAKNETCNPNYGLPLGCKTENTTYSGFVKKIIDSQCIGCHKSSNPSGGINLEGYSNVKISVDNGKFFNSINWVSSYVKMPLNGSKMDTCTLNKIKYWIDNGAKNN
jgi:hypothetical protein